MRVYLHQVNYHIKKRSKMPAFLCHYNDLEKMPMGAWDNCPLSRWRTLGFLLLFWAVFLSTVDSCRAAADSDTVIAAHVTKVIDGDTIEVRYSGKDVRVRLWGIDTPEWEQNFSREARDFTRRRLAGRQVELGVKTRDSYGRLVAVVMVDGNSFHEELLREGLAWVHIYYCKEPVCRKWRQLEKEARNARRGLWRESHPVAPWQWKQTHR
jgi:endonuclease YncB( thermonuclease family)